MKPNRTHPPLNPQGIQCTYSAEFDAKRGPARQAFDFDKTLVSGYKLKDFFYGNFQASTQLQKKQQRNNPTWSSLTHEYA